MIILDIDMPECCGTCQFASIYDTGGASGMQCRITGERTWGKSKEEDNTFKFSNCPIVKEINITK